MAENSQVAHEFAQRLVSAMKAKGLTSDRIRSGVDVSALSKAVGVSYEMARRYLEGRANPSPDVVNSIAQWLGMSPASLLHGDSSGSGDVNLTALERCVLAVSDAQVMSGVTLTGEEAARIVAQLYAEAVHGNSPSVPTIAALIRATKKT